MAWDANRKSHEGLLKAGYRGPMQPDGETGGAHPARCRFCDREILWYVSKNDKFQPFTAGTFEPHHGDCPPYAAMRKQQKAESAA